MAKRTSRSTFPNRWLYSTTIYNTFIPWRQSFQDNKECKNVISSISKTKSLHTGVFLYDNYLIVVRKIATGPFQFTFSTQREIPSQAQSQEGIWCLGQEQGQTSDELAFSSEEAKRKSWLSADTIHKEHCRDYVHRKLRKSPAEDRYYTNDYTRNCWQLWASTHFIV